MPLPAVLTFASAREVFSATRTPESANEIAGHGPKDQSVAREFERDLRAWLKMDGFAQVGWNHDLSLGGDSGETDWHVLHFGTGKTQTATPLLAS